MSGWKKLAAASAAGGGLNVEDLFSTYLYDGTGAQQTITNGIDFDGEGGLVWFKARTNATTGNHYAWDTERGADRRLSPNRSDPQTTGVSSNFVSFNSNGATLGSSFIINQSGQEYASWSFRKAPKFFDIVTWNGNSTARTISHNLGQTPGMILVKTRSNDRNWAVWHKDLVNNTGFLQLNTTNSESSDSAVFTATNPTSTEFSIGTDFRVNYSSWTYVAYVFADNNGAGEFGPDGDQDIIKCGNYTGNGSPTGPVVNVGFEPQFLLIKGSSGNWVMVDSMRGFATKPAYSEVLQANTLNTENGVDWFGVTPTGFQLRDGSSDINSNGHNYIYMAIRRGPMAAPESATDVFNPTYAYQYDIEGNTSSGNGIHGYLGKPTDLYLQGYLSGSSLNAIVRSRITGGNYVITNVASAETNSSIKFWDNNVASGFVTSNSVNTSLITWNWSRAPGYLDIVNYTGTGSNTTIGHNLGAVPTMMWIKCRDGDEEWCVYHSGAGATKFLTLNQNYGTQTSSQRWNNTTPTDTQFSLGSHRDVNRNGQTYIAYLFGEVSGISKMGAYTGTGNTLVIDCGFTSGARFVLIKRTDSTSDWFVFDTARGITSGNVSRLMLNLGAGYPAVTNTNFVNPNNSGFELPGGGTEVNETPRTYVFYAIA